MIVWLAGVGLPSPSPSSQPTSFGAGVVTVSFLLSLLIWTPVVMAFVIALIPRGGRTRLERWPLGVAFWTMVGTLAVAVIGYSQFQSVSGGLQFEERLPWLPSIGVSYHLGVDGISMSVLLLNQLIGLVSVLAGWEMRDRPRAYFALLLLTQAAVTGVVAAQDFFLFFLFWALAAVPVALLVGGWVRRPGASARVLGYWAFGSAALLGGGLLLYRATGASSFDLSSLGAIQGQTRLQFFAGVLFLLAAASRLPLVPLHGWVKDVYRDAPAGVAILVAGAASRLGGYELIRLLAGAEHEGAKRLAPYLGILAAVTVGYAGLAALRSRQVRGVAAYLALVPGGLTLLGLAGLTPLSLHGAVLSLFAGGLAAALIAGAAATLAERAGTGRVELAAGLATRMPILAWLFAAGALSVLGLPFLATFGSNLMIFLGSFGTVPAPAFAVAAALVLVAGAVAWLLQRTLFGAPNREGPAPEEATLPEKWHLGILVGALLWVGLVPGGPKLVGIPLFDPGLINVINPGVAELAAAYAPPPPPATPTPSAKPSPGPAQPGSASPSPAAPASPASSPVPSGAP